MISCTRFMRSFGFAHIINVIEAQNSSLCCLRYVCTPQFPQANHFKHFRRTSDGSGNWSKRSSFPVWKGAKIKSIAFAYSAQGIASSSCQERNSPGFSFFANRSLRNIVMSNYFIRCFCGFGGQLCLCTCWKSVEIDGEDAFWSSFHRKDLHTSSVSCTDVEIIHFNLLDFKCRSNYL